MSYLIGTREWCPECKAMQKIVDVHTEGVPESGYMRRSTTEVEYNVHDYACGHSQSWRGRSTTYRDPA